MFSKFFSLFKTPKAPLSTKRPKEAPHLMKEKTKEKVLFKAPKTPLSARELLKVATQLKKEKKYDEACEKLKAAYVADGRELLMTKDFLRLPMYLQLAKRNDEGWGVLNELNTKFTDTFSQAEIANQMRVFLQKEKKFKLAIQFSTWHICKEIERDRSNVIGSEDFADQMAEMDSKYSLMDEFDEKEEIVGETEKGNPITDRSYLMFKERIEYLQSYQAVEDSLKGNIKKANLSVIEKDICQAISDYLTKEKNYQRRKVRDILDTFYSSI